MVTWTHKRSRCFIIILASCCSITWLMTLSFFFFFGTYIGKYIANDFTFFFVGNKSNRYSLPCLLNMSAIPYVFNLSHKIYRKYAYVFRWKYENIHTDSIHLPNFLVNLCLRRNNFLLDAENKDYVSTKWYLNLLRVLKWCYKCALKWSYVWILNDYDTSFPNLYNTKIKKEKRN